MIANILSSFGQLRTLESPAVFLITGIDMTKLPSLPWQSDKFVLLELGAGRRFEILTPDSLIREIRLAGSKPFENRYLSLANGDFIRRHPPRYVLAYTGDGILMSTKEVKWRDPSIDDVAGAIPEIAAVLRGRSIEALDVSEDKTFETLADYWGLWDAVMALRYKLALSEPDETKLTMKARRREGELKTVSFAAVPASTGASGGSSRLRLRWTVPGASDLELHVGAPSGPFIGEVGPIGAADVGAWAAPGTRVLLQDVTLDRPLTYSNTLAVLQLPIASDVGARSPMFADPNPIRLDRGKELGKTKVHWNVPYGDVEIRVNGERGPLLAHQGGTGIVETGDWVQDGMLFYLRASKPLRAGDKSVRVESVVVHAVASSE